MADVKSYAWSERLSAAVAPGDTVEIATPGFQSPEDYETDKTEMVCDADVIPAGEFTTSWASDFTHVVLTNTSEAKTWDATSTVYVTVPGKPFDAAGVEDSFNALANRVTALETKTGELETQVTSLDARVTALETPATASAAHAPAPSQAPPPEPAPPPPNHVPPPHHGAPQHRGKAK
jgi:hypothetical protein